MEKRRKFWGWGIEGQGPSEEQTSAIAGTLAERFGTEVGKARPVPRLEDLDLRPVRIQATGALAEIFSSDPYDRAGHTYGKAFRDVVRALDGDFSPAPDLVAFPRNEAEVTAVLDWSTDQGAGVIPYGGGSSVVGGIEARDFGQRPAVSLDMSGMSGVLEIDRRSRAARIEAGTLGPALEDQLRPEGLTLRHFPQSFEFSTLGGWIATRSGGHYATLYTHIDDFVESLRVVTPAGPVESRRLPGSGAGPSPDRMFVGSEGSLGVITEAWMRLQDRPRFRASAAVTFAEFATAVEAVRVLSQSGLNPSNLRLLDANEALTSGAGNGAENVLIVGFESADHQLDAWMERAVEICREHGGTVPDEAVRTHSEGAGARQGAAGTWRKSFLQAPYIRDSLVRLGFVSETFETAITWDRFEDFHASVSQAARQAIEQICGSGMLSCRFTHVYPDGPAPYFSVLAPARAGSQLAQWDELKSAVSEALHAAGGTITHHHAVGRDHRPWYDRQRPGGFADALSAAKGSLDPGAIMNPGVIV